MSKRKKKKKERQYNPHIVAKKASLSLKLKPNQVVIQSIFSVTNSANWAVVAISLVSLGVVIFTLQYGEEWWAILIGLLLGGTMLVFGLLTIVKQFSDFLRVTDTHIYCRHNLKKKQFAITPDMKLKIMHERVFTSSDEHSGSYNRIADIILITDKQEHALVNFQMTDSQGAEIHFLAKHIGDLIEEKIEKAQ